MPNVIEYKLLDPVLEAEIAAMPEDQRRTYVFLQAHPEYKTYFKVNSFDPFYLREFHDLIGDWQAISMWKIPMLHERAIETGYKLVFLTDPRPFFDLIEELKEPFPFELNFELKHFQAQGFNFLKDKPAAIVEWSTGTGKSVYGCAKAKYLRESGKVDKTVIVSKAHNRVNWVRQLRLVANIDATLIGFRWNEEKSKYVQVPGKSAVEKRAIRAEQYIESDVFVINYEKFRDDEAELTAALSGQRVHFIWDEMPTKLKTRAAALYKGTQRTLKACGTTYQDMLSATPVENVPEDLYNCVKLMDKDALDKRVMDFRSRYAQQWNTFSPNKVAVWNTVRLKEIGMRLAHMTHKASKYTDPDIAAQFPTEQWEQLYIEMSETDRKLYNAVRDQIISEFWEGTMSTQNILQRMGALQIICNNPAFLNSAAGDFAWAIRSKNPPSDKHCAKLDMLKDMVEQTEGKIVLFTMFNNLGAAPLSQYIRDWGYDCVLYRSQADEDRFKADPDCKVFISSDRGSDSISLEVAQTVINYDLPWKYSTLLQRVNRVNRITSKTLGGVYGTGVNHVYYYDFMMVDTIEERKRQILDRKKAYADAIDSEVDEQMEQISTLTKNELWFMLTGEEAPDG